MSETSTDPAPAQKQGPGRLRQGIGAVLLLLLLGYLGAHYRVLPGFRPSPPGPEFADPADRRTVGSHPALGPHGGTLGVIGDEAAHVELLHDTASGTLTLHLLGPDAITELALTEASLRVTVRFGDETRTLDLEATGPAAGPRHYRGQDPWLRGKSTFIVKLPAIAVPGETGVELDLPFPAGNDAVSLARGKP